LEHEPREFAAPLDRPVIQLVAHAARYQRSSAATSTAIATSAITAAGVTPAPGSERSPRATAVTIAFAAGRSRRGTLTLNAPCSDSSPIVSVRRASMPAFASAAFHDRARRVPHTTT